MEPFIDHVQLWGKLLPALPEGLYKSLDPAPSLAGFLDFRFLKSFWGKHPAQLSDNKVVRSERSQVVDVGAHVSNRSLIK